MASTTTSTLPNTPSSHMTTIHLLNKMASPRYPAGSEMALRQVIWEHAKPNTPFDPYATRHFSCGSLKMKWTPPKPIMLRLKSISPKRPTLGGKKSLSASPSPKRSIVGGKKPLSASPSPKRSMVGGKKPLSVSPSPKRSMLGGKKPLSVSPSPKRSMLGGKKPLSASPSPRVTKIRFYSSSARLASAKLLPLPPSPSVAKLLTMLKPINTSSTESTSPKIKQEDMNNNIDSLGLPVYSIQKGVNMLNAMAAPRPKRITKIHFPDSIFNQCNIPIPSIETDK